MKTKTSPVCIDSLAINPELVTGILTEFIREEVHNSGFERVLLGLSGGIDSAVSAALAVNALGAGQVTGVKMPYRTSSPDSAAHADLLAEKLGIPTLLEPVTAVVDAYLERHPDADELRRGNLMARARMLTLFDLSQQQQALVLGTSNKSELMLGYGTLFGDLASAINPLGDLYKTQLFQMAEWLGIPDEIRHKPPSADLVEGQTDEQDLGWSYDRLDCVLRVLVDNRCTIADALEQGLEEKLVRHVQDLISRTQFKRMGPLIPKLSTRTIGIDFHLNRDNLR
ncbi:MAG: NAD+ synthase [Candidatus Delongbacteria bacterium]|nr:NAD+ synthase [Candidatus Delongbacteria bacterium]